MVISRSVLAAIAVVGLGCAHADVGLADTDALKIAMLIPGNIADGGFMQAGYEGLLATVPEGRLLQADEG